MEIAIWLGHTSPIYFLSAVVLVLFSRCLLAEFSHYRIALRLSWFNILLLGLALYWSWNDATHEHLLCDDLPADIHPAVVRRIVIAQSLYATGAALCFINTRDGIAAIVPGRLNFAIAPGLCWGLATRMRHGATSLRPGIAAQLDPS